MRVVAFESSHLRTLELQDAQSYFVSDVNSADYGAGLEQSGQAFTILHGDDVLLCGGCVEVWPHRAMAWTLVSRSAGAHMVAITRIVAGYLLAAKWRRVEAYVDEGFAPGLRWMRLLGFVQETAQPMRAFRPDGHNCFMFSRVK